LHIEYYFHRQTILWVTMSTIGVMTNAHRVTLSPVDISHWRAYRLPHNDQGRNTEQERGLTVAKYANRTPVEAGPPSYPAARLCMGSVRLSISITQCCLSLATNICHRSDTCSSSLAESHIHCGPASITHYYADISLYYSLLPSGNPYKPGKTRINPEFFDPYFRGD